MTEQKEKTRPPFTSDLAGLSTGAEELAQAFLQQAQRPALSFQYDDTGDPALLHQYALVCGNAFNRLGGLSAGGHRASFASLAHQGRQCVGGAQTIVSFPRDTRALPCEQQGFNLQKSLPELELYNVAYGEILDMAALPEYQQEEIAAELLHRLIHQAIRQGVQYLFMVSTPLRTNRHDQMAHGFGLPCMLRPDITLPEYAEFAGGHALLTIFDLTALESDTYVDAAGETIGRKHPRV